MLILQRNIGETINIGDNIQVQVTRINPRSVHIAVKAPKDIEIWRNEIYKIKKEEKIKIERIIDGYKEVNL
jgi:carbon storage regulator